MESYSMLFFFFGFFYPALFWDLSTSLSVSIASRYIIICLSIHLLMSIWVALSFEVLEIKILWRSVHKSLHIRILAFLLGVKWMGHMYTFTRNCQIVFQLFVLFCIPTSSVWVFIPPYPQQQEYPIVIQSSCIHTWEFLFIYLFFTVGRVSTLMH